VTMGHPFFDAASFPWHHADAAPAQQALLAAYPQFDTIDILYRRCAPGLRPLSKYERPDTLWKDALEGLTAARALRRLCELVLEDPAAAAAHDAIRCLVVATGPSGASSSPTQPGRRIVCFITTSDGLHPRFGCVCGPGRQHVTVMCLDPPASDKAADESVFSRSVRHHVVYWRSQ